MIKYYKIVNRVALIFLYVNFLLNLYIFRQKQKQKKKKKKNRKQLILH